MSPTNPWIFPILLELISSELLGLCNNSLGIEATKAIYRIYSTSIALYYQDVSFQFLVLEYLDITIEHLGFLQNSFGSTA